jgi:type-IV secretion system protein TraC
MGRDFHIYVSCSLNISKRNKSKSINDVVNFQKKLFSKFKALKLSPVNCTAEDLMGLSADILQMSTGSKLKRRYDPYNPLSSQILKPLHRTRIDEETIYHVEDKLATKCFYPVSLPQEFSLLEMIELLGRDDEAMTIPARFIISYSLANNLGSSGESKTISEGMRAIHAAEQWYTRHDVNLKKEAAEWRKILARNKGGEKFLTENMTVIITAPEEHIDIAAETLKSLYNSKDWQLAINNNLQLITLLSTLPMQQAAYWKTLKAFQLVKVVLAREVVAKIPIHGEWKGAPRSGVMLLGRRGQLFNWTPFYRVGGAGNFNVCVMAPAGGGKSIFLQELATSMMCQGVAVFILDIGGSYQNICDLVDGVNIRFNASNEMSLNPFRGLANNGLKYTRAGELLKSGKEFDEVCIETHLSQDQLLAYIKGLTDGNSSGNKSNDSNDSYSINSRDEQSTKEQDTIEILKIGKNFVTKDSIIYARSIIAAMCNVKGNAHLEAIIGAAISKGIEEHGDDLDITKLATILNDQDSSEHGKILAETLYPFTEKGIHGRYFKSGKVASFKELITNFEFEEIKNDPVLLGVVLQVILMQITMQFLCGDRSKQFVLIVDEAWMILDFCSPFLEAFARTVRKYGGALITCVQDLSSFHKGPSQKAILENSSWKAILKQSRLEAFNNDDEFKGHVPLIESITKEASGKYSEVLLQTSGLTVVGRLVLDPYSIALYSTEAEDYNFIANNKKAGISVDEVVESLSKKYGTLPDLTQKTVTVDHSKLLSTTTRIGAQNVTN